jgi:hypothetical protein
VYFLRVIIAPRGGKLRGGCSARSQQPRGKMSFWDGPPIREGRKAGRVVNAMPPCSFQSVQKRTVNYESGQRVAEDGYEA